MNYKQLVELNTLTPDGKLYFNPRLDTIEALVPTPFGSNHAADLVELPNGDLLCAWFAGTDEGNADISIALSRLDADSSQWTQAEVISDDPSRSEQNPSLFLNPNGEVWAMYTAQVSRESMPNAEFNLQYTAEIRRKISKDNGQTWGETTTMFDRPGSFCRQKIQILKNGRWIFGNWICFNDSTRNGSDITVMQISDDKGKTWRSVEVPESRGLVHANLIEVGPNKLVALFRSRAADNIYRSESNDNGESWTAPERTELPNNNASISAIALKSGRIAVIYNQHRVNDDRTKTEWPFERIPVTVALSEDGGKTWPYRRHIETGEGYCGEKNIGANRRYEYPVIIQTKDGRIHAAYSFGNRICMKHVVFDEAWILGMD